MGHSHSADVYNQNVISSTSEYMMSSESEYSHVLYSH